MKRRLTAIIGLALAAPALAQSPADSSALPASVGAAPAPIAPARLALGRTLARTLNSEALTRAQLDKMIADTMPRTFRANPNFQELEQRYPGIIDALVDSVAGPMRESATVKLPSLWDRLAPVYAGALSEDELREADRFYNGAVGRKIVGIMGRESDFSQLTKQVVDDPDSNITAAGLRAGIVAGAVRVDAELTVSERAEAAAFIASPAGRKAVAVTPRVQSVAAAMSNESDPDLDAKLEAAVTAAIKRFTSPPAAKK